MTKPSLVRHGAPRQLLFKTWSASLRRSPAADQRKGRGEGVTNAALAYGVGERTSAGEK